VLILLPPSEKKADNQGPAISVYTGVLYQALSWTSLPKAAQNRGTKSIAIFSAKYGAISPTTIIRPYKEKIDNKKMGPLISEKLDQHETELIIDCRSSTYQVAWRSPIEKTVEIKVYTKVGSVKKTITHMSKRTRGEVVRAVLLSQVVPKNPEQLKQIVMESFNCKLIRGGQTTPWILETYI
jgi:cytoplasmic iron level regulating protein YaaA (DUF328/UPF0246 family)